MKLQGIITATIAVIMIMLIAVPLIDDASSTVRTEENNTTQKFLVSDAEASVDIRPNSSGIYTVNGVEYPQVYMYIYMATDNMVCYYGNATTTIQQIMILCPSGIYVAHHVIVEDGAWKAYDSSDELVHSEAVVGKIYCTSNQGDYGYFDVKSNAPLYINDDSNLMGINLTITATASDDTTIKVLMYCRGTYDDMEIIACQNIGTALPIDPSNVSITPIVATAQDNDSLKITSSLITATITVDGKTYVGERNLFLFAPIEYKTISDNDSIIITLLQLVPVLLIVALVLGISYEIAYKRE